MSVTSKLFRAARLSATTRALTSGDPHRIANRAKNITVGREMARTGIWRALWRQWLR